MIFIGNPGTGKTTIARLVAKYLKAIGVLSNGQLKEVTRANLVGEYVGHTAKLINQVIQFSLGSVLFPILYYKVKMISERKRLIHWLN